MTSKCCPLFLIIVLFACNNARFVFIETEDGSGQNFDSDEDIGKKCVDSQGNEHRPGQKFKEGCNDCYCYEDGSGMCTRRGCNVPSLVHKRSRKSINQSSKF